MLSHVIEKSCLPGVVRTGKFLSTERRVFHFPIRKALPTLRRSSLGGDEKKGGLKNGCAEFYQLSILT
jgi:hypothetical protein